MLTHRKIVIPSIIQEHANHQQNAQHSRSHTYAQIEATPLTSSSLQMDQNQATTTCNMGTQLEKRYQTIYKEIILGKNHNQFYISL